MNTAEIRKAAGDFIRGRAILRAAFPAIPAEGIEALALVIAGDAPTSNADDPKIAAADFHPESTIATREKARRTSRGTKSTAAGRSTLEVDLGDNTRIPLIDAVVGIFQQKTRGTELTLTDIVDEFKHLGWRVLTRNKDWTFPIRERIKREGAGLITWRSVRPEGVRHARDMFTLTNPRVALSQTSRNAIDASARKVVQHIATVN